MVLAGCALAFLRRSQDEGDAATQRFDLDILPLLLLIAVSATGLLLTAPKPGCRAATSAPWPSSTRSRSSSCCCSCPSASCSTSSSGRPRPAWPATRPRARPWALLPCRACRTPFIRANQRADLERLWRELGLDGARHGNGAHHLDLCPRCKRRLLLKAHDLRLDGAFDPFAEVPLPVEPLADPISFRS